MNRRQFWFYSFIASPAMGLHSAIVMPYLTHYGTKDQQEKYLPAMTAGECIARCVMSSKTNLPFPHTRMTFINRMMGAWIHHSKGDI